MSSKKKKKKKLILCACCVCGKIYQDTPGGQICSDGCLEEAKSEAQSQENEKYNPDRR